MTDAKSSGTWTRSTFCGGDGCAEASIRPGVVELRNSTSTHGPVVEYTHDEWAAFIAGVKAGEFDI